MPTWSSLGKQRTMDTNAADELGQVRRDPDVAHTADECGL